MRPIIIKEEEGRLEILLQVAGRRSVGVILLTINAILGIIFLVALITGLLNVKDGAEYLLPSVAVFIFLGWVGYLAIWHWYGSETIILERNVIRWQHDFVFYKPPEKSFYWRSLEAVFLKEKQNTTTRKSYGRLLFKSPDCQFKSLVIQDSQQGQMLLRMIQVFFNKLKEESEREKDPKELLFPHKVFHGGTGELAKTVMLN